MWNGHFIIMVNFRFIILLGIAFMMLGLLSNKAFSNVSYYYAKDSKDIAVQNWQAKWIWLAGLSYSDNNHRLLARKTFSVTKLPTTARLAITADSHYELWVNGEFISRGPARSNAHHQSYDLIDVLPKLKKGNNVIAVRVHFHGQIKTYYGNTYPGLLVQLDLNLEDKVNQRSIITDKSWKVSKDHSWDSHSEWVSSVNANNYASNIHFGRVPKFWQELEFDDKQWQQAVYQTGPKSWPKRAKGYIPYAIQKPWLSLVPRDLPPLREFIQRPKRVLTVTEAPQYSKQGWWGDAKSYDGLHHSVQDVQLSLKHSKLSSISAFIKGEKSLKIENYYPDVKSKLGRELAYHSTVIFDFGSVIDGYPFIKLKGGRGGIVDINYAPYLLDGKFVPGILVDNFSDRLTLSGKQDSWSNSELRTFRYLAITIRGSAPVTVDNIGLQVTEYPFNKLGEISVNGEHFLQEFWQAGDRTLQSITTDAFTDNYQERRQYVQTAYYAALGAYAAYGDTWLQRRLLKQHAEDQLPDGIMPMWAPWSVYDKNSMTPGIFEANHFWLMGLHDYYLFSGDRESTEQLMVSAERLAESIYRYQRHGKLLYKLPHPYWIDWAKLAQGDENFIINALQLRAFSDYAELLNWLGNTELAEKWQRRSEVIRLELKSFWHADSGLFADNRNDGKLDLNFSEHANALAVVFGIAEKNQIDSIITKLLKNDKQQTMETVALFNYWLVEAVAGQGKTMEAVALLKRRYQHMISDKELNTLWEYPKLHVQDKGRRIAMLGNSWVGRSWSTAQAENAYPAASLSRWILGITPIKPGMRELALTSLSSPYKAFSGKLPTPEGLVTLSKQDKQLSIHLPEGVSARISLAEQSRLQGKLLYIDEVKHVLGTGDIIISSGTHQLTLH